MKENIIQEYYSHVLGEKKSIGAKAKAFDIVNDLTDRRGLRQEWDNIDGEIQAEIIETWMKIIEKQDL